MKCVFFTHQQYNIDKIHIPKQSLYLELTSFNKNDNEIGELIDKNIDDVYNKLNEGNRTGVPIKIPMPIFILMGRQLDYDRSIFDNERFGTDFKQPFKYGNEVIRPDVINKRGSLVIVDYLKSFFKSGLGETPRDEEKYNNSLANVYKFKGNKKIIIYIPYLSNEYRYISNFMDIANSSRFFFTLISKNNFLGFRRTTTADFEKLRKQFKNPPYSDKAIRNIIEIIRNQEKNKFGFYDDLYKLCKEGGCISKDGEDFTRLLPEYNEDEGTNNENATKYSPFIPNKCLAQTQGYIRNVRDAKSGNLDVPEFLKAEAMNDIKSGLENYLRESEKTARTGTTNEEDIMKYKSPVDLIIEYRNTKIKNGYGTNLNDGDKRNHYSREYSQNIIKELAFLRKIYPGIPEIVMSLYLYKKESNRVIYMPWGKTIISNRNVISLGDILEVDKKLYSFNNRFILTVNVNGFIYVIDRNSGNIVYFLNRNPINKVSGMTFETNGIAVEFMDSDNNKKSRTVGINNLIGDCEECKKPPYSIILNDNDGGLKIYSNSFYDATSRELNEFIKKEMVYVNETRRRGINDFNADNIEFKMDLKNDLRNEDEYLYCADIEKGCKK